MWNCEKCHKSVPDDYKFCDNCGIGKDGSTPAQRGLVIARSIKSYPALRLMSLAYKILAVILLCLGLAIALGGVFSLSPLLVILAVTVTGVLFLSLLAVSETLFVFVDIAESARGTKELVERLAAK